MTDRKLFFLLTVLSVMSTNSMYVSESLPCGMLLLPHDVARNKIQSLLSFQEIARLKQSSQWCNRVCDVEHVCPLFCTHTCSTYACAQLAKNYYACSKALSHFARNKDEYMFMHLWMHHAQVRNKDIIEICKCSVVSVKNQMDVYSKRYSNEKNIRKHIVKCGARAICKYHDRDCAKTVFAGGGLSIFDLLKEYGCQKESKDYFNVYFIFYKAAWLDDSELIKHLCGGTVDERSFKYIMRYADPGLLSNLICDDILTPDITSKSRKSLLHYVAHKGLAHIIKILLDKGAYVNCVDEEGMTPLHYAVKKVHIDAVLMLLTSADADVRFVDKRGKKALDYAIPTQRFMLGMSDDLADRKTIQGILQSHLEKSSAHAYSYAKIHSNGYQKLRV